MHTTHSIEKLAIASSFFAHSPWYDYILCVLRLSCDFLCLPLALPFSVSVSPERFSDSFSLFLGFGD